MDKVESAAAGEAAGARPERRAPGVLASWTLRLLDTLAPEAERRERLLQRVGLGRWAEDPDAYLPYAAAAELWRGLTEGHDDVDIGLHFAERADPSALGVLGYLAAASPTAGEALLRVERYHRLLKAPGEIRVELSPEVRVVDQPPPELRPWPRHLAEAVLGAYVVLLRRWTGRPLVASRVRFQHGRPRRTAEHERVFGCAPEFGAAENELRLGAVAGLPLSGADAALSRYLDAQASRTLREGPSDDALGEALRRAICDALPAGYPEIDDVARSLGLSVRSLQRKLEARGVCYRDVVDQVRLDLARRLLDDEGLSVAEIAAMVGFADSRGFQRAYRRWTGKAPRRGGH